METAELSRAEYWVDPEPDLRCSPVGSPDQEGLRDFARSTEALAGHVLVATSGTRNAPKWIAVSKKAILASARAVNRHLASTGSDRWLLALPAFHVGGLGVFARAHLTGSSVSVFAGRWRGRVREFAEQCAAENAILTALTPTQVFDLVKERISAPPRLRAVVVGGGGLDGEIGSQARQLGWPVLQSYGMTEACSQIATESLEALSHPFAGEWLPVLPHWEVRAKEAFGLEIRGEALFSGTVQKGASEKWEFVSVPLDGEGFFLTSDRVEWRIHKNSPQIRFLSRCDDLVKILGELVSMNELREKFVRIQRESGRNGTLLALPDSRNDHRIVAVVEGEEFDPGIRGRIESEFNAAVAPFERICQVAFVPELPRTAIGKIAYGRLYEHLTSGDSGPDPES